MILVKRKKINIRIRYWVVIFKIPSKISSDAHVYLCPWCWTRITWPPSPVSFPWPLQAFVCPFFFEPTQTERLRLQFPLNDATIQTGRFCRSVSAAGCFPVAIVSRQTAQCDHGRRLLVRLGEPPVWRAEILLSENTGGLQRTEGGPDALPRWSLLQVGVLLVPD